MVRPNSSFEAESVDLEVSFELSTDGHHEQELISPQVKRCAITQSHMGYYKQVKVWY